MLNTAALTKIETMKTDDGFPLLRPFNQAEGGIGYTLLGFPVEEEDAIDILIHQIHQYSISVISLSFIFKMLLDH